jgi:AmmeMemoRadiSam system protein B
MSDVRPAAVAGMFYPGARSALSAELRAHLTQASARERAQHPVPKAIIVPHAGYMYSGGIAASAYVRVAPARKTIRRVVMFGPTHRVAVGGLALPSTRAFATPFGPVEVDRRAVALALSLPQVEINDEAHALEHSLEVQLPFLQAVLEDFRIVPFAVGATDADEVADVMERLWGGPETLIVVSSDLSHYHPYAEAARIDRRSADAILAARPRLDHDEACGATPINGLLACAARHELDAELLDLRNSGDTAGDRSRVVGYASFAFVERGHAA